MNFTKDFDIVRLTHSDTATRNHIEEQFNPSTEVIENLERLAKNILQPLHDSIGEFFVTCAYRCPTVNKAVGGAATSQHLTGEAADCVYSKGNILLAKRILELGLVFDQMIIEGGTMQRPNWIHISHSGKRNRGEILRADFSTGKAAYSHLTKEQILNLK